MSVEDDARWCVVGEEQVHRGRQPVDVLARVVSLGVALKVRGATAVVRGSMAATNAAHREPAEVERCSFRR
jgi:hypothetical protein